MASNKALLRPRKSPRQSRSAHTCAMIEEAAARILEEQGLSGLTTNKVAERAGVSIGSLYQYYPAKEALLAALLREKRRELLSGIKEAADAVAPLAATLDALLDAALAHQLARPRLSLALEYAEAILPLDEETRALKATLAQAVAAVFHRHGLPEAEIAAQDCVAMARGIIDAAGLAGETDASAVKARVKRAIWGYLALPNP